MYLWNLLVASNGVNTVKTCKHGSHIVYDLWFIPTINLFVTHLYRVQHAMYLKILHLIWHTFITKFYFAFLNVALSLIIFFHLSTNYDTLRDMNHICGPYDIKAYTVYPKKYAHGFVVLCFVVVMQSFIMNSHEVFIHIHQGCFAGTGAIVRLPQCQWSKPDGYGKISQCITTTKHSKAKTVCIFLGIYCKPGADDDVQSLRIHVCSHSTMMTEEHWQSSFVISNPSWVDFWGSIKLIFKIFIISKLLYVTIGVVKSPGLMQISIWNQSDSFPWLTLVVERGYDTAC